MAEKKKPEQTEHNAPKTIRISKKALYITLTLVLLIAILSLAFLIYQKNFQISEVDLYKKAAFDSLLCQYSCEVKEITVGNETRMLPTPDCINTCVTELNSRGFVQGQFTDEALVLDNLLVELDTAIQFCRTNAVIDITGDLDYSSYFPCAKQALEEIKSRYPYLR